VDASATEDESSSGSVARSDRLREKERPGKECRRGRGGRLPGRVRRCLGDRIGGARKSAWHGLLDASGWTSRAGSAGLGVPHALGGLFCAGDFFGGFASSPSSSFFFVSNSSFVMIP
jgi:hypothetical protein